MPNANEYSLYKDSAVKTSGSSVNYNADMYSRSIGASKYKGSGVRIGVIDTGVPTHQDLVGRVAAYENFSRSKSPFDLDGHCSHVSGVLCGNEGSRVTGVAPKAKLYIAKALDDSGYCSMESLTKAIEWCIEKKVHIIVMSLGAPHKFLKRAWALRRAIRKAYAADIAIFAAAGNTGKSLDIPARWKEVFSVGAIDSDGKHCEFSAKGPSIDFCGYGYNIFSTYMNNNYAVMSGTSAAVPGVAGVAALVLSKYPGTKPADLRKRMVQMCHDYGDEGWDESTGWGVPVFGIEDGRMVITNQGLVDEDPEEPPSLFERIKNSISGIFSRK